MTDINKEELRRLAEAMPDLDWDSEFEDHEQTGFCTVYAKPFEIDGEEHEGPTFVPRCTADQARFIADGKASILALLDELEEDRGAIAVWRGRTQRAEAERDALRAEVRALRSQQADWQAECLKKGFEYVREPDDHYVVATPAEMVSLLRDLLGVDVRQKDSADYGVSVAELEEQVEGLVNTVHSLEALRKDAERYRWLRDKQTFIWLIQDWFPKDAEMTDVDAEIDAAMSKGERQDG